MKTYGHYTSMQGLMSIAQNRALWASNIKYLNDEHELQHSLDIAKRIVKNAMPANGAKNKARTDFNTEILERLDGLGEFGSDIVFTTSFTEETDLLSQWRGYCPNNNGYCIVYDVEQVFNEVKEKYRDSFFVSCIYDDMEKERQLSKVIDRQWEKYSSVKADSLKKEALTALLDDVLILSSYFKDRSFEEEKEHRIVVMCKPSFEDNIKFRPGPFSLIPYVEIPAPCASIQKIVIGPTAQKVLSRRALTSFLDESFKPMGSEMIDIEMSKTPYRPW